jgi:hypothetical protein
MARALEAHLALMHREHFGDYSLITSKTTEGSSKALGTTGAGDGVGDDAKAMASSSSSSSSAVDDEEGGEGGGGSAYLSGFSDALTQLSTNHLCRMPNHSQAPFVKKALAELAARLTRSFVSHASLVRPLTQKGRTRLTQDMALFEMALTPLLWPSGSEGTGSGSGGGGGRGSVAEALGRSGQELHAFKNALFLEDDNEPPATALRRILNSDRDGPSTGPVSSSSSSSLLPSSSLGVGGGSGGVAASPLRPSTLVHHCFSRADCPLTLSSPHDHLIDNNGSSGSGCSGSGSSGSGGGDKEQHNNQHTALVEWLVAGAPLPPGCAYAKVSPMPMGGLMDNLPAESGAAREAVAWAAVCACLDTHAQRMSASSSSSSSSSSGPDGKSSSSGGGGGGGSGSSEAAGVDNSNKSSSSGGTDEYYEVLLDEGGALVERYLRSFLQARGQPHQNN